ncbi:hypothetical protein [Microlunatus parietis]|uniref:Uncharacterized protein n=1 Tax=Microlunatus parietis TaxID=682979 RepID=A0A7Y9LBM8_9ACTN|nr:hypothetical protein [Microlunatus parietis]NYE71897.1 hypothetical protein [Microlunatus parietis]
MTGRPELRGYGLVQLARRLGFEQWQVERARELVWIPSPDVDGRRWSAAVVDRLAGQVDEIRAGIGSIPDLGATRAAAVLADRFGIAVTPDAVVELGRRGRLTGAGSYKDARLFSGLGLQYFDDRDALVEAIRVGRCVLADDAARFMEIRRTDFDHLVRARLLVPARWTWSRWQPRRAEPDVALYRVGDLETLLADERIDWAAVRSTPAGRRSPLADLPTFGPEVSS